MTNLKKLLALLLALAMVFSLAACGDDAETEVETSAGSTVEDGANDEPADAATGAASIDCLNVGTVDKLGVFLAGSTNGSGIMTGHLVFDYLFTYDRHTGEYNSDVLDRWEYKDDTTFVMTLKEGITFADGNTMTGEDVLYSLYTYQDDETNSFGNYTNMIDFDASSVDGNVITVKFLYAYGPGLFGDKFPIYEKEWGENRGYDSSDWINNPMGSGPYVVSEYVTDSYILFTKRTDYWDPDSVADMPNQIKLSYYAEAATEFIDLETGAIQLAMNISANDYARGVEGVDGINVEAISDGTNMYLALAVRDNEILQDENVRAAICYGVDWNTVIEAGVGDLWIESTSVLNSSSAFYKNIGHYGYEPEKAKDYLSQSAYADSAITLNYFGPELESQKNQIEVVQYYLGEIGIDLNINFGDFPSCIQAWMTPGGSDMSFNAFNGGSTNGEPADYLAAYTTDSVMSVCVIGDEQYDDMFSRASQTVDETERQQIYDELAQYCYEHFLLINVAENVAGIAYNSSVIAATSFNSATNADLRQIGYVG